LSLLPKYNPPTSGSPVDRRESDRPRNTIVRLPKNLLPPESITASAAADNHGQPPEGVVRLPRYDVRERRLPKFKERELLTPTARVDLHLKRHPGLRIGNLFGLNRGIARAMIDISLLKWKLLNLHGRDKSIASEGKRMETLWKDLQPFRSSS
jgi:hypothetical protein